MLPKVASPFVAMLWLPVFILAGCGGEKSPDWLSNDPTASKNEVVGEALINRRVTIGQASWLPWYQSLSEMKRVSEAVIVGRVEAVLLPYDDRTGYLGQPTPDYSSAAIDAEPIDPADAGAIDEAAKFYLEEKLKTIQTPSPEELSRPPGAGLTVFSVRITRKLWETNIKEGPALAAGATIAVMQSGGAKGDVAYETGGDPVMEVGRTYLFFLQQFDGLKDISVEQPWGITYAGPPYGRFLLDQAGRLQIVDGMWDCEGCGGPLALSGKTVDEAEALIANPAAETASEAVPE